MGTTHEQLNKTIESTLHAMRIKPVECVVTRQSLSLEFKTVADARAAVMLLSPHFKCTDVEIDPDTQSPYIELPLGAA